MICDNCMEEGGFTYCDDCVQSMRRELQQQLAEKDRRIAELEDAIESLVDEQNGPPLLKYEKEWAAAMNRASVLLGRPEPYPTPEGEG